MIVKVLEGTRCTIPIYKTWGSAGADIYANESKMLFIGDTALIGTGLFLEIQEGYEMQIRSRSGMALKGIVVANSPGTVDFDYRGEVKVMLYNQGKFNFQIKEGDRIAQAVISPVCSANYVMASELSDTVRGSGGLGSTGT